MAKSGGSYKISPLNGLQHSLADRADERPKTAWSRIYLCTLLTFSSSVQFTMFFTSMYPFLRTKDKTVSEGFFGVVITMYSVSQIIASPLLGIWSNQIGKLKPPLILCNLTMFVGNLIYFLIELFPPEHTRYVMLVSRFIVGIGWAQVGLLKSFASAASLPEDRTKATAYITGGVALGVILGPALQMVFTFIGDGVLLFEFSDHSFLKLSMFTMPALFTSIFNIFLILLLVFKFQETFVGFAGAMKQTDKKSEDGKESLSPTLPPYDKWAAGVCFAMRFTQYFIYTNLETFGIGSGYAMMMFMWDEKDVVYYESIAHAVRGLFAICNYGAYIFCDLGKKVNDRLCCLCSLFVLLFFHLVTFSWPFLPEKVHSYNGTLVNSSKGCDISQLNWCADMTRVNIWIYYIAISSCIGIAFSNINITMNTLFSHIIGPRMQSKQQGMLEMFGGFGRMLGPLLIGFMYTNNGPRVIWLVEMGEIVLMIVLWLFFYRRLVPLKMPPADDALTDRESTESEGRQQNGKQSLTGNVT